jgi:hypothetical protein
MIRAAKVEKSFGYTLFIYKNFEFINTWKLDEISLISKR